MTATVDGWVWLIPFLLPAALQTFNSQRPSRNTCKDHL
jgi:hypothetical protein